MQTEDKERALDLAARFCNERHPACEAAFLCGSWARGQQHDGSDIDLVIVDPAVAGQRFEGIWFMGHVLDTCVAEYNALVRLFEECVAYRSAPVPQQMMDCIQVRGSPDLGAKLKRLAAEVVVGGPAPLTDSERRELRWEISTLMVELRHASAADLFSLSAQCHVQLSRAWLAIANARRCERKHLARAVENSNPERSARLDRALLRCCAGDRDEMLRLAGELLEPLGGFDRTYCEVYP
ncbi:MAG: nucleotidyltransferase domain-containing protein [bacterium]